VYSVYDLCYAHTNAQLALAARSVMDGVAAASSSNLPGKAITTQGCNDNSDVRLKQPDAKHRQEVLAMQPAALQPQAAVIALQR
jgi:hypothetical protein